MSVDDNSGGTARRDGVSTDVLELPSFSLEVIAGPDKGKSLVVDATAENSRIHLGTSAVCALALTDPLVSRRHLAFSIEPGAVRMTDLGSTNGTTIGGTRCVEVILTGGEAIRVGDTTVSFQRLRDQRVSMTPAFGFGRVLGGSPEMRKLFPLLARLAHSDVPVILEGETGTGKELVAEAIHEAGPRARGAFVVFDCTVGPSVVLDANLFGQEASAGGGTDRPGLFEMAEGGTLFIDEIGDMDVALQAKLLRAVQRREIQRVGGTKWRPIDVRILVATRRDLDKEIQAGRFRDDLYYRLAGARVDLPALRHRTGDVALLSQHFWGQLGGKGDLPEAFRKRAETYAWPGNVRELYNAVAHEIALGDLGDVDILQRPSTPPNAAPEPADDLIEKVLSRELPYPRAREDVLRLFDERFVRRVLAKHDGNVTRAAAASGIGRRYFHMIKARNRTS